MKTFLKSLIAKIFFLSFVLFLVGPVVVSAATSPILGATGTYAITSSTYTNSLNAALETAINGDLCYTTGPGTNPVSISGATVVPCGPARGTDQSSALADVNSQTCTNLGVNVVLSGTYTPGCYYSTGTMNIVLSTTVTLNGAGTYIFRSGGALTTGSNSLVALTGGASSCDVFWAPGGATTIGANAATSPTPTFVGTILQNSLNAFDVTVGHFVNLNGRILAFGRTVTTDSNTITVPSGCTPTPPILHVIKHVVNNSGGAAVASAWNLAVSSSNSGTGIGNAAGAESPGTTYTLQAGKAYSVAESGGPIGYSQSLSSDCTIANAVAGDIYNCTITNDDIDPELTVTKVVVGGTKVISDFSLRVDGSSVTSGVANLVSPGLHTVSEVADPAYTSAITGDCASNGTITIAFGDNKFCIITNTYITPTLATPQGGGPLTTPLVPPLIAVVKVPTPLALPNGPGSVIYTYTLRNVGTVPVSNITMVDDSCSPIRLISGDTNNDSILETNETWVYNCATTLSQTHTNTVVATGWANGISSVDMASATVVVGMPIVPPLIHVTKIPDPSTLPAEGGTVTYTESVTNPGTVPLSNVSLSDSKCNPVYVSGDTDNDSKLESNETWIYRCQTRLAQTTTNTVVAEGSANGITARDFAIVTVVVNTPGLPKTGYPPRGKIIPQDTIILVGVAMLFSSLVIGAMLLNL